MEVIALRMLLPLLRSPFTSSARVGLGLLYPCAKIWTCQQTTRMADSKEKTVDNPENCADKLSELKLKQIEDDVASSYILVDIGANLTNSKYSRDLDSVVERAKDAGLYMTVYHHHNHNTSKIWFQSRSEKDYGDWGFSSVQ